MSQKKITDYGDSYLLDLQLSPINTDKKGKDYDLELRLHLSQCS